MARRLVVGWILLLLLGLAPQARADAVVTLCAADDQPGSGTNLASAIPRGGHITFACGAATTILLNCHAEIVADTEIDGGGKITLKDNSAAGPGCGSPLGSIHFAVFHDKPMRTFAFKLTNVNLVGSKPPPKSVLFYLKGQLVFGNLDLTVTGSTLTGWQYPIAVAPGQAIVDSSTLSDNAGVAVDAPLIVVRHHASFSGNEGVPLRSAGGAVVIADSAFTSNQSGSLLESCSSIDIRHATFDSNVSQGTGGALTTGCDTRIASSVFKNNRARTGGAIYIGDRAAHTDLVAVDFEGNQASADGGAIALRYELYAPVPPPQTVALHGVTFKSNSAQVAGALEFARDALPGVALSPRKLTVAGTQFIDNHAAVAAGVLVARANAEFDGTLFIGNKADQGGGALVSLQKGDGRSTLANSLLVKNSAPIGAAVLGQAVALINSTLADNAGVAVSGTRMVPILTTFDPGPVAQPIALHNAILSSAAGPPCGPPNSAAPYLDLGHNLQQGGKACGAGIAVASPQFGPSYIPLPTSPAAHGGDDATCASAPVGGRDLWGDVRPDGGHCAIGAAEANLRQMVQQAGGPTLRALGDLLHCACLRRSR